MAEQGGNSHSHSLDLGFGVIDKPLLTLDQVTDAGYTLLHALSGKGYIPDSRITDQIVAIMTQASDYEELRGKVLSAEHCSNILGSLMLAFLQADCKDG